MERLHPAMLKQMRACGIAVEVQDTVRSEQRGWHDGTGALPTVSWDSACPELGRREGIGCPMEKGCVSWGLTPSFCYSTAKCVCNLQLPDK